MKIWKTLALASTLAAPSFYGPLGATSTATSTPSGPSNSMNMPGAELPVPPPGLLNLLVIVLDDVGADQLKIYGVDPGPPTTCASAQVTTTPTPTLNALRATGLMFSRAYVNPLCSPTRACLMTGRYGVRTGIGAVNSFTLPSSNLFLPELIRDHNPCNYARGAFGKWHMAAEVAAEDTHPADNGFENFQGPRANLLDFYTWLKVTATGGSAELASTATSEIIGPGAAPPSEETYVSSVTRRDAATWINQQTRPFFAYVCFNPPHAPFQVPPTQLLSKKTRAKLANLGYEPGEIAGALRTDQIMIYQAALEAVDREIFQLMLAIAPKLLNTMIVVVGDNGTPPDIVLDPALSGKVKRSVYELGTRVPLLISGPLTWFNAGRTHRSLVSAVDMFRTLANFTGIPNTTIDSVIASRGELNDSISFYRQVLSPSQPGTRTTAYAELFANGPVPIPPNSSWLRSNTDGSYRYVRNRLRGAITEELYALATDPCNVTDLTKPPHVLTPEEQTALTNLRSAMLAIAP